ncbi:MAG: cytochrome P460 family protein [Verrucomicrobiota bacterium]
MNSRIHFLNGWPLVFLAGALCLGGCASQSDTMGEAGSKVTDVAANFTTYRKMTDRAAEIDPYISFRCSPIMKDEVAEARLEHGPHANTAILVYMNDLAAGTFTNRAQFYPVGSVIVKQKVIKGYYDEKYRQLASRSNAVGGMIKRPVGYDPAHGDWEYFYFEKPAKIERGRLATCVKCHSYAQTTDHVYGTWQKH